MTAPKCAHWGNHGAAGLLVVGKGKVLLQLRSQGVREPHTWSIPGGARGKDETPEDAALREAAEETGIDPEAVKIVATTSDLCECGWEYVTCVANLVGAVDLHGNWESQELRWVPLKDVDALQLHPGFKAVWPALRDMLKAGDRRPNITQLTEQLWTGGDRGQTAPLTWLTQLHSAGITHVIDCRPHGRADQAYVRTHAPQIGYLLNGQPDNGQKMPDEWFADGVDFALHAMRDPAAQVVAHCQLGINRGPSMAFAVLLATGMTPEQARSTIVAARPIARIRYADQAAKWWADLTAPEVFYHGGHPGLKVGDFLLPPALTGHSTRVDRITARIGVPCPPSLQAVLDHEKGRVFLTQDILYAAQMAAQFPVAGTVYQVEPMGSITHGRSFMGVIKETRCDRARVVALVVKGVTWDKAIQFGTEELARRKATS